MKKKKSWVILLVLIILILLAIGAVFLWQHFSAGAVEGSVYVQSLAEITGVGYAGMNNSYAGVVEAKEVIEINPDSDLTIKECFVSAGDPVKAGAQLFCYDVDEMTLAHDQLLIDISGLEGSILTYTEEIAQLEKRIARARESQLYDLKLELQTAQLNLKKANYELADKRKKADNMLTVINDSIVLSPVDGIVRSVRTDNADANMFGYSDGDASAAYITIVAGNDFCVKGRVSEQTIHTLMEGMPATVRSRTDKNRVYAGTIYKVNTTEADKSTNNNYYYSSDQGEQASKYAFYVSIDNIEGLIIGQHVFIELGEQDDGDSGWKLPEYYIVTEGDKSFVYAADSNGRIEERAITLGEYDADMGSYAVTAGLALTDKIAFPDETVQAGMKATETQYTEENMGGENMGGENMGDGELSPAAADEPYGG